MATVLGLTYGYIKPWAGRTKFETEPTRETYFQTAAEETRLFNPTRTDFIKNNKADRPDPNHREKL